MPDKNNKLISAKEKQVIESPSNYSLDDVTSIKDDYFSEEGVEGKEASLIILTPSHRQAHAKKVKAVKKKNYNWQKTENRLNSYAEGSNIGLAIKVAFSFDMITKFIPFFHIISIGLSAVMSVADPAIYFFRALIRVTRLVGRHFYGITFDHEEKGRHKWQSYADAASLILFSFTIPLFAGLIITSPVGITVAWAIAISGLVVSLYFDYASPAKFAKQFYLNKLEEMAKGEATQEDVDNAYKDYEIKKVAKRLFAAVLFNVSILTLCTSALAFAPALIVPVLKLATQCASGLLALLAIARYVNSKRSKVASPKDEAEPETSVSCDSPHESTKENKLLNGKTLSPSVKIHLAVKDNAGLKDKIIVLRENADFVMEVATPKGKLNRNHFFADYMSAEGVVQHQVVSNDKNGADRSSRKRVV